MDNFKEEQRYIKAKKRVKEIKGFYVHLTVYVLVNIFISCIVIFGLTRNEHLSFSEAIIHPGNLGTWFGWGIGIFIHWLTVFGFPSLISKDWEERKIKELMQKDGEKEGYHLNK